MRERVQVQVRGGVLDISVDFVVDDLVNHVFVAVFKCVLLEGFGFRRGVRSRFLCRFLALFLGDQEEHGEQRCKKGRRKQDDRKDHVCFEHLGFECGRYEQGYDDEHRRDQLECIANSIKQKSAFAVQAGDAAKQVQADQTQKRADCDNEEGDARRIIVDAQSVGCGADERGGLRAGVNKRGKGRKRKNDV